MNDTFLGDTPYVDYGMQQDLRRLFYSEYDRAMTKAISLPAGYGIVPMGTVIAAVSEAAGGRAELYVPYVKERPILGDAEAFGAAYLLEDGAADENIVVTMEDSYKFAVGDHLAIADNTNYASAGTSAKDLGAIVSIDRTTYPHKAVIVVTNTVTTNYTVARGAWVYIQTTTATPFTKAAGILVGGVDTGTGVGSKGGMGVMLLSNAMLYVAMVRNYNSDVATDLGTVTDGRFLIVK